MQASLLLRLMLTTVIFAITMAAVALWLFRFSLFGLTGMARTKAV